MSASSLISPNTGEIKAAETSVHFQLLRVNHPKAAAAVVERPR